MYKRNYWTYIIQTTQSANLFSNIILNFTRSTNQPTNNNNSANNSQNATQINNQPTIEQLKYKVWRKHSQSKLKDAINEYNNTINENDNEADMI
jgi:hypothetical protein